jgi:glutathione S-transferase
MIKLYSMPSSGNSYKARLLLAKLGIPFQHISAEYGEDRLTATREFLAKNPAGKVPLIEFEDGQCLSESNAILHYFGEGTRFVPTDKLERAKVYQWLFWEQNVHEASVAVRMATFNYPQREMDRSPECMEALLQSGNSALDVMEQQLAKTPFLVGETISIADVCLYGYTHRADMGGFDVKSRKGIIAWLEQVANDAGHVPIEWIPEEEK